MFSAPRDRRFRTRQVSGRRVSTAGGSFRHDQLLAGSLVLGGAGSPYPERAIRLVDWAACAPGWPRIRPVGGEACGGTSHWKSASTRCSWGSWRSALLGRAAGRWPWSIGATDAPCNFGQRGRDPLRRGRIRNDGPVGRWIGCALCDDCQQHGVLVQLQGVAETTVLLRPSQCEQSSDARST